jgi:tRNA C32,U32 (ribose-2'-O)-methylase TrmJ
MPWTYNKMGYPGKKIGSLFGVITHIMENRSVDDEQISELTEMKRRYYQDRYITPKDLNLLINIASSAEEKKKKGRKKK